MLIQTRDLERRLEHDLARALRQGEPERPQDLMWKRGAVR
jgi:hypothetical protein